MDLWPIAHHLVVVSKRMRQPEINDQEVDGDDREGKLDFLTSRHRAAVRNGTRGHCQ